MGYYCCVPLCNSNSKKKNGVSFHGFTKDKRMREIWLHNIRRDVNSKSNPFKINNHTKICSLHFLKSDFKIASEKWRLKPEAVPTIFAWTKKDVQEKLIKIPYIPKTEDERCCEQKKNEETKTIENKEKTNDYRLMYLQTINENRHLKSEYENLKYRFRDQEELYDNLVVVNKTTQRENEDLKKTIFVLQEYLKNLAQKQFLLDTKILEQNQEKQLLNLLCNNNK